MTADRTTREQLAAALKPPIRYSPTRTAVVAALLPVVDRIAAERAAAELRAAAEDWWKPGRPHRPVRDWLRARADALDPTPGVPSVTKPSHAQPTPVHPTGTVRPSQEQAGAFTTTSETTSPSATVTEQSATTTETTTEAATSEPAATTSATPTTTEQSEETP